MAVKTHGLTHINLAVQDPERAVRFYRQVFGVKEYYRDAMSIQVLGPGPHDVLAFEKAKRKPGSTGGIGHFGFRLVKAEDLDAAVRAVRRAGGAPRAGGGVAPRAPRAVRRALHG